MVKQRACPWIIICCFLNVLLAFRCWGLRLSYRARAPHPFEFSEGRCLIEKEPRPSIVAGSRKSQPTLRVGRHDVIRPLLTDGVVNSGMLAADAPDVRSLRGDCIRDELPKIIHMIWVGSPFRDTHARNVVQISEKNPAWSIYLWVDQKIGEDSPLVPWLDTPEDAKELMKYKRGAILLKWLPTEGPSFRNWDLIGDEMATKSFAGASDYIRMEVIYRYGGIYLDTDFHASHSFDDFGKVFRWPFVSYVHDDMKKTLSNSVFGFESGSSFLDFALNATRENCYKFSKCGVVDGAGGHFLTGAYLRYNDPDILLIHQKHLTPQAPAALDDSVMVHDMEGNWLVGEYGDGRRKHPGA
eukprot:gnl/TRDRNA2_/TRDRNA2_190576_c0_seq1.p1 gnl/TRDRNA2_/TRDRNA2_190576_c0~~gnl/TRDRNA2_/TRDRNA2_190576_c0_seq1.p1  ORF type:complete len:355 (-),score=37.51 gnl/TRDRNA2_/TRDRNA2_190576_c0_seq1:151-1215(-)